MSGRYDIRLPIRFFQFMAFGVCWVPLHLAVGTLIAEVRAGDPLPNGRMWATAILAAFVIPLGFAVYYWTAEPRRYPAGVVATVDAGGVQFHGPPVAVRWNQVAEIAAVELRVHQPGESPSDKYFVVTTGAGWNEVRELFSAPDVDRMAAFAPSGVVVRAAGPFDVTVEWRPDGR